MSSPDEVDPFGAGYSELRLSYDELAQLLDGEPVEFPGDGHVSPFTKLVPPEPLPSGFTPHDVETGDRILESELTDETYRVTRWVEHEDGRVTALEKRPVDPGDA